MSCSVTKAPNGSNLFQPLTELQVYVAPTGPVLLDAHHDLLTVAFRIADAVHEVVARDDLVLVVEDENDVGFVRKGHGPFEVTCAHPAYVGRLALERGDRDHRYVEIQCQILQRRRDAADVGLLVTGERLGDLLQVVDEDRRCFRCAAGRCGEI